jgi:hypothetical protein
MTGKKLFTDQLFQALHLLADSRLGTADRRSRSCKCIQIGDCNKSSQQIEIEVQYRTICIHHIFSLTGGSCGAAPGRSCVRKSKTDPSEQDSLRSRHGRLPDGKFESRYIRRQTQRIWRYFLLSLRSVYIDVYRIM